MNRAKKGEINDWSEIPEFADEEEEARFWSSHSLGPRLLGQMRRLPGGVTSLARGQTRPVSVRLDDDVIARLKSLAERKGTGYLTLLKQFVLERLYEEEKRAG